MKRIKQKLSNIKDFIMANERDGVTETVRYLLTNNKPESKNLLVSMLNPIRRLMLPIAS